MKRRGRKREHVVDDGRLLEQAVDGGQWRLGAHHAATAFKAFEQGGFLAAHIGAGANAQFDIEGMARAENVRAEIARGARVNERFVECLDAVRIFGAAVDIAFGRADGYGADRHAFDQHVGVVFEDHAVGERAAVALVAIADDIFAIGFGVGDGLPFDAGRETGAAAAAQPGFRNLFDDCSAANLNGALQTKPALVGGIILNRDGIRDAATGEGQARLAV